MLKQIRDDVAAWLTANGWAVTSPTAETVQGANKAELGITVVSSVPLGPNLKRILALVEIVVREVSTDAAYDKLLERVGDMVDGIAMASFGLFGQAIPEAEIEPDVFGYYEARISFEIDYEVEKEP